MKKNRGFTLTEVLIALGILSIFVGFSVTSITSIVRSNSGNKAQVQALAASDAWLERFRAKSLDFNTFSTSQTYDYKYNYAGDSTFIAPGDANAAQLNQEWQPYKFVVKTSQYKTTPNPVIWKIDITTTFLAAGGESSFVTSTLVAQ